VLTLSGVNTYQDGTTIQGGTIAVNADNRLGAAAIVPHLPTGGLRRFLQYRYRDDDVAEKGTALKVHVKADGGKETIFSISLKGFGGAFDRNGHAVEIGRPHPPVDPQ